MPDRVGQQLGNYRLTNLLGEGGFGEVYLAEHLYLKTPAAIKVLHTRLTPEDQQRFLSEAQTVARLRHPYIVQVLDFGIEGSTPYLAMDYAPGGTLRARHPRGTALPPTAILAYVKQIADALQYAHDQRLIHRDIKPENLLLGRNNEVLLGDFGIATVAQTTSDLKTQGFAGTATYAAPEQLRGKPVQASDQYALAVIVYEWLTGDTPFHGSPLEVATQQVLSPPPPLREKLPGISPAVEQVVLTALAKEPKERFGSVRAFGTALEQAMQTAPAALSNFAPPAAPTTYQTRPEQPGQAGGGAIYFAPTQLTPPSPSIQPGNLPNNPAQGTPPPGNTLASPATPAGWAGSAPSGAPPPASPTFTWSASPTSPIQYPPGGWAPAAPGPGGAPGVAVPPSPKHTTRNWVLALLVIVVLVGGGVGVAVLARHSGSSPQASHSTATRPAGPTLTPTPQIKRGGTITDGLLQEPDSLLSSGSTQTFAALVDATIWAPLIYGDPQGNLHPGLLKEIPTVANGGISADALHYTLKLRAGLKWSDGQPLTSDDVVFTLNLWNNPAYGAKQTFGGLSFINFSTLRAVNPTTVTFSMKQVYIPLLAQQLTDPQLAPMPKHVFGAMAPSSILKSNENFMPAVTSGPFMVSERVRADHITVVKNPNYYQANQGLPYLDRIVFKIIPDSSTILTALQSGALDTAWFLDISKLSGYQAISGYTLSNAPGAFEELVFNLHNVILADLQVRKAISMALDLDNIIKIAVHGQGERTCDEDIGTFAHNSSQTCYPFDPATAKSILDADGWAVGPDGYRQKNGQTLELRWSTTANNARRSQGEQIAQSNLKDIGIKIDIINYPADTEFGTILPSGNFDIGEYANSLIYDPDNSTVWLCKESPDKDPSGFNFGFYCNPTVDQAIITEETNPDQNARLQAFRTIQQAILTDLPAIYLYNYGNLAINSNALHNYSPSGTGPSETWNVWEWWKS